MQCKNTKVIFNMLHAFLVVMNDRKLTELPSTQRTGTEKSNERNITRL